MVRRAVLSLVLVACGPGASSRALELDGHDFGIVPSGLAVAALVGLRNTGSASLVIDRVDIDDPAFTVSELRGAFLHGGASIALNVQFDSRSPLRSDHAATLTVRATDGTFAKATFTGVSAFIECRPELDGVDFLGVALGRSGRQQLKVTNRSAIPDTARVTSISGADRLAFAVAPAVVEEVTLQPGEEHGFDLTFAAGVVRDYSAHAVVLVGRCPLAIAPLRGTSVTSVAECPDVQTLPDTALGQTSQSAWLVVNYGAAPVTLTQLDATPRPELRVGADAGTIGVPAARRSSSGVIAPGTARVPLVFTPAMLGDRSGTLRAVTSIAGQEQLTCTVTGRARGPDIDVAPLMLDLPADGGVGVVTVRNTAPVQDPYGTLQLLGFNRTGPATLTVGLTPQAIPPQGSADVTFSTTSPGNWLVTLSSNDLDEPAVAIVVRSAP